MLDGVGRAVSDGGPYPITRFVEVVLRHQSRTWFHGRQARCEAELRAI